jgi:peptidoglycan/xylan/chitin deacetylase (PgdA/CDA1 family)
LGTVISGVACKKVSLPEATVAPVETSAPAPEKAVAPEPAKVPATAVGPDTKASVVVLCYHRFEEKPKDSLGLPPAEFERQMDALKEHGFTVIPMRDFLLWRRGEKVLPEKSALITVDDGYRSVYEAAWPILKAREYPFTLFIYTNYVKGQPNAGGQSMSWGELAEMRDAGVDIQSHTVSHSNMKFEKGKWASKYKTGEEWLKAEMEVSKKMLEQKLGIPVGAVAYPYGVHNQKIRAAAMDAGYEVAFTTYGQRVSYHTPADQIGRYAIESGKPQIFEDAMRMIGGSGDAGTVRTNASATMVTVPAEGAVVSDPRPVVKANLASLGEVDAASLVVRVSGVGKLDVKYDAATKLMEARFLEPIRERENVVLVSGKSGAKRFELRWTFIYEAKAGEAKAGEAKVGEAKVGEAKAGEAKVGEAKAGEAKAGVPELRVPSALPAAVPAGVVGGGGGDAVLPAVPGR